MATYNDTRNWDQKELDRARELAKDNVVSDGASVPQAAKVLADQQLDTATPSPVLEGDRPTTEDERKAVVDGTLVNSEDVDADEKAGLANFQSNSPADKKSNKKSK